MSFSDYVRKMREKDLKWFFGENVEMVSNKYFKFKRVIDKDNIIILTKDVKCLKGNYVLIVDNDKGVYLKDWQVRCAHNFEQGVEFYVVKLNRKYFNPYTFKFKFDDMCFEKEQTFDDMFETAKEQEVRNLEIALG